jgi:hypothetical protein
VIISGLVRDAALWRAFCWDVEAGTFPRALLTDAKEMGAGVFDMHYQIMVPPCALDGLVDRWRAKADEEAFYAEQRAARHVYASCSNQLYAAISCAEAIAHKGRVP